MKDQLCLLPFISKISKWRWTIDYIFQSRWGRRAACSTATTSYPGTSKPGCLFAYKLYMERPFQINHSQISWFDFTIFT